MIPGWWGGGMKGSQRRRKRNNLTCNTDVKVWKVGQETFCKLRRVRKAMDVYLCTVSSVTRQSGMRKNANLVFRWHIIFHDLLCIRLCLPCMDYEWLSETDSVSQLPCKNLALDFMWRFTVMVVQPNLAPCNASRVSHGLQSVGRRLASGLGRKV